MGDKKDNEYKLHVNTETNVELTEEQKKKIKKGSKCDVCSKHFTYFKRPYVCKHCEKDVCFKCSKGNIILSILGLNKVRVCINCLPKLKLLIEQKMKENPELKQKGEKQLKQLDLLIEGKHVDFDFSIDVSDDDDKDENEKDTKHKDKDTKDNKHKDTELKI